jgi:succinoglycan biosynthesis transport protein ExoP
MYLSSFFKLLLRHKYTLIIVPVVTIVITFFLVRNQPDSYLSESEIATGIVDQTRSINSDGTAPQESVVAQEFNNLITMLRSKKVLNQLSYQLMIHDLTNRDAPYRKPSKLLTLLNTDARDHAIKVYSQMYSSMQALSLFNQDQNGLNSLMASMGYDDQSLLKKLSIYRDNNSDYIYISFESENPELSAYVVNTLSQEFIKYYTFLVKTNQRRSVAFYANLLQVKQDTLNARTNALRNYKIRNRVLNPSEQAKVLYGQISDFETRRTGAPPVRSTLNLTRGIVAMQKVP